ncbi:MAG: DUF493 family protein [Rectinemataceae bacterium]|nr:DUF493 family protein [Rectinemataceae bacterium]
MEENAPACSGPFAGAAIDYPVHFDLRIIYTLAEAPDMVARLEAVLTALAVPCSMVQGVAKPGAKYGRMGARITVDSKLTMNRLYAEVGKIPGVKAVI